MTGAAPPWGVPWHGMLKDGKVELPNGETVPMRQPSGGDTHLIDFGAPEPATTTEQADQGMEWKNKAIISNDQIHGVRIGAGSWIYRAPDGSNWLVETTLNGARDITTEVELKLTLFGVFGASKIEHIYSLPLPSTASESGYWGLYGQVSFHMQSCHPSGSAAVFGMLSGSYKYPLAWLELTLTGAAADCDASISIIRTAAQTAGVKSESGVIPSSEQASSGKFYEASVDFKWVPGSYPGGCTGTYTAEINLDEVAERTPNSFPVSYQEYTLDFIRTYTGIIIALNYDDSGSIVETNLSTSMTVTGSSSAPSISTTAGSKTWDVYPNHADQACALENGRAEPWSLTATQSATITHAVTMDVTVGGASSLSLSSYVTCTASIALGAGGFDTGGQQPALSSRSLTYSWDTDGLPQSLSQTLGGTLSALTMGGLIDNDFPWFVGWGDVGESHPIASAYMGVQALGPNSVYTAIADIELERYSNSVNSASQRLRDVDLPFPRTSDLSGPKPPNVDINIDRGSSLATPDGAKPTDPRVGYNGPLYASYNPITKEAVRTSDGSINWT